MIFRPGHLIGFILCFMVVIIGVRYEWTVEKILTAIIAIAFLSLFIAVSITIYLQHIGYE